MSKIKLISISILTLIVLNLSIHAQTSSFTYQGSLNDGATAANGTYQMRFTLFNAQTGGNPVSSPIEITAVQVTSGVFSVSLDFGAAVFDGSNRFLQVEVRRNAGETYVALSPREQIKSVPYSVRSATSGNADQLGGVSSTQYVTTSSNAFIQNGTAQQTGNFNISGTGTAQVLNSNSEYRINGQRIVAAPLNNTVVGFNSGTNLQSGGNGNTLVGNLAGQSITSNNNTLIGFEAGKNTTIGLQNTFVGYKAGENNISGEYNVFIGDGVGLSFTNGRFNTFVGGQAGERSNIANSNTFIGDNAGDTNVDGSNNTILGEQADVGVNNLNFATAIGSESVVSTSNTIQLGRSSDRTNISGSFNVLNGRPLPVERGNINFVTNSGNMDLYMQGGGNGNGINIAVSSPAAGNATLLISQYNGTTYQDRLVINANGAVEVRQLGSGGSVSLCRNSSLEIALCSSSMRYKSDVANFSDGLNIIKKLRPVSFNWTDGGMLDFGLVAEEVAEVAPLLTTQNVDGKTEGVKYDRVGVVLVNAVNEQQDQIEAQQTQIEAQSQENKGLKTKIETLEETVERQNRMIESLRLLICADKPEAEICRTKNKEEK